LDRDLGLDSLSRAELFLRLERAFRIRLPEQLLAEAETAGDLLAVVLQGGEGGVSNVDVSVRALVLGAAAAPVNAKTLQDVLDWHAQVHPSRLHIVLEGLEGRSASVSYGDLRHESLVISRGIGRHKLAPGATVAIMLPTSREYFGAFFGALYAGTVPVPVYPPSRMTQLEEHFRRQMLILNNAEANLLIVPREIWPLARMLQAQVRSLGAVTTVEDLMADGGTEGVPLPNRAEDVALLQYTSGSTGDPKGVVLTHANLLANIRAMGEAIAPTPDDVFVSWLPLYHDMGLIGAWLASLYYAVPTVLMSPLQFLARPETWLRAIHRHRGTVSAAPNFGYELCVRAISDQEIEGIDLSSWRLAFNGSEPVSASTVRRFVERFARHGFRAEAMAPAYGLAECGVGLTLPPLGRPPMIDRIRRASLATSGIAEPATSADANALDIVACGVPLPDHQVRIVDSEGREIGERREGRVQFCGPSATSGYYRNPEKTASLFKGEWLETGDLGYIAAGNLYLTGRSKDVIIRAGRKLHPHELEEAVGDIPGIRKGGVAVFGSVEPVSRVERAIVLAETDETAPEGREIIRQRIDEAAILILGAAADEILLAAPGTVPKTASGKIRRAACRELYEQNRIGIPRRSVRWQLVRLWLAGVHARFHRMRQLAGDLFYAGYWWVVVAVFAGLTWLLVTIVLPRRAWRWAVVHWAAKSMLWLAGVGPDIRGLERIPASGRCILVANHSSYLDIVVLSAVLPGQPVFVAKHELSENRWARRFLSRLNTLFVERIDPQRGIEDIRSAIEATRAGERLVFFPEGTLTRMPGLLPFRLGAFQVAAETAATVLPIAIRGTRPILRGGQWFPRRGRIAVTIAEPIAPSGSGFSAAVGLRDAVRQALLRLMGEPDLEKTRIEMPGARTLER
jgi:1-acyl-sn-glycerol-3-phosphate acyltransferase